LVTAASAAASRATPESETWPAEPPVPATVVPPAPAAVVPAVLRSPPLPPPVFEPPLPALDMPAPPLAASAPEPAVMLECGVRSLVLQAIAAVAIDVRHKSFMSSTIAAWP
jgi:hypothetical protein